MCPFEGINTGRSEGKHELLVKMFELKQVSKEGDWLSGTVTKEVAIEITDGVFTKIIPNEELVEEPGLTIIDGHHQLILPGLIENIVTLIKVN